MYNVLARKAQDYSKRSLLTVQLGTFTDLLPFFLPPRVLSTKSASFFPNALNRIKMDLTTRKLLFLTS